jgi:hypothetical protein
VGAPLPGTWKVEILSGGFVYWAFREICKIRLWKRAGCGTWREACFTGDFERQMKKGFGNGASVYGSSARGTWRNP